MSSNERKKSKDHIDFPVHWEQNSYRIVSKIRRTSKDRFRIALKPYFLGINQVAVDAPINHPAHNHSSFELIVVKRGPYRCLLNGESVVLEDSECLLIKPGDMHEVDCQPGQRHYVLQFDLEEKELGDNRTIFVFNRTIRPTDQAIQASIEEIEPILKAIAEESRADRRFASEIQDSLTELIFWILISYTSEDRLAPAFRKLSADQRFLDRLERLAQSNASKHMNLDELAKLMEISKSTLAKRCSTLLGESPSQYLLRSKIDLAVKLLATTNMRIKEVSFELGFQNPYHFSRVFKRVTGRSPSDFRQSNVDASE